MPPDAIQNEASDSGDSEEQAPQEMSEWERRLETLSKKEK